MSNPVNPFFEEAEEIEYEEVKTAAAPRRENLADGRTPLNHAKDTSTYETAGGMQFRRSRTGLDHSSKMALDIPTKLLNDELKYRWVNDSSGRVEKLREIGYEVVDQKSLSKGEEISTRRRVGTNKDGSALFAQLMATPKKWHEERQSSAEDSRLKKERGIFTGQTDGSGDALDKSFYNKGSKIST